MVSTGAVAYRGTTLGPGCILGDYAGVRERCTLGEKVVVGRSSVVENDTVIGDFTKIQTNVYITAYMTIEDRCFIAPCVQTTNDNFMGRTEKRHELIKGATIRRGARVGGGVVLCPAIEIGAEAFIAAGAVVTKDAPAAQGAHGRAGARRARRLRGRAAREPVRPGAALVRATGPGPAPRSRGQRQPPFRLTAPLIAVMLAARSLERPSSPRRRRTWQRGHIDLRRIDEEVLMKIRPVLVCVAAAGAGVVVCRAPALAAPSLAGGRFYYYTAENARVTGTQSVWKGWKHRRPGGSTINWNRSRTAGATRGAPRSPASPPGRPSACVGFSVTADGVPSLWA